MNGEMTKDWQFLASASWENHLAHCKWMEGTQVGTLHGADVLTE